MTRLSSPPRRETDAASDRAPGPSAQHGAGSARPRMSEQSQPPRRPRRLPDQLRDFVRRYGWRAYALPVLAVITVIVLLPSGGRSDGGTSPTGGQAAPAPPTASSNGQVKVDQAGANAVGTVEDAAALPPGPSYTEQGNGTFSVVPGASAVAGTGPLRRYTVEYENGITGIDMNAVASTIEATLGDPRSWTGDGAFSLQRVDSGQIDFRITITSSITVRGLCGYEQQIETSCFDPTTGRVVLNDSRWVRGAVAYANDIDTYRRYMINHESGHALGFEHVYTCLPGGKAPVMMQQTISVQAQDGQMCQPNPWPHPTS